MLNGRDARGNLVKCHQTPPEIRAKIAATLTGRKNGRGWSAGLRKETDDRIARMSRAKIGKPSPKRGVPVSEEQKLKQSQTMKGRKQTEELRQRRRLNPVRYWLGKSIPVDARKKMGERKRLSWQDPTYVRRVMEGRHISPNKAELKLLRLLESLYPGEWKYTGDFSFTINGKCPDFVNCNGQKKIIELFGDYWHQGHSPEARASAFAPFGYMTLVIWGSELKDMRALESKIRAFHEKRA